MTGLRTGSGCTKMMLVLVPVIRASRRCVPVLLVDVMYLYSYQCYKYLDPWLCMFRVLDNVHGFMLPSIAVKIILDAVS